MAADPRRLAIDAILLEYDVQTRDRRLYAQSMFGTIGFVVAGGVALLAATAQSKEPLILLLIPPLLLAGGVLIVVLRIHLLRVSVFLSVVEEDLRQRLGEATYPVVWETTMTGRTGAVTSVTSPARASAGLSMTIMLVMGIALSVVLVWPATLLYWQAGGVSGVDLIGKLALLIGVQRTLVEWAYPAINLVLVGYIAFAWLRLPNTLEAARIHFRRTRLRIADDSDEVRLDRAPCPRPQATRAQCWEARWLGWRDGELVTIEHIVLNSRSQALVWARRRAHRLLQRADGSGELERVS